MTEPTSKPLILLPGLGADARQFDPQRAEFPNLQAPAWIPHDEHESLRDYARRVAGTLEVARPFYLGGSSFGGMVAQEVATLLEPEAVFLVASARHGEQIAPHLRYFVRFASILPARTFEMGKGLTPLYVSKFGDLSPGERELLEAMVADTLPAFVRWGIAAITAWEGVGELPMPVYHIHGSDDQLIPADQVDADRIIPGGGHLLNVTHADEVNAFIAERMR